MSVPFIPSASWAFGTLEERNLGGLPCMLFADSVLPWTKNPLWIGPPGVPPTPGWWDPPIPAYNRGEFEGWHRNMGENAGSGAKNFPPNRGLRLVLPTLKGLKDSRTAPYRTVGEGGLDWRWPFGDTDGITADPTATELMLHYLDAYLEDGTFFVAQISERDAMNALDIKGDPPKPDQLLPGIPNPPASPAPDPAMGRAAIRGYVRAMFDIGGDSRARPGQLRAWYSVDEPDLEARRQWATPAKMGELRRLVREYELEARIDFDFPTGFASLPRIEQEAHLLPMILTFSQNWDLQARLIEPPTRLTKKQLEQIQPRSYFNAGAADIYFVDYYPCRRTREEVRIEVQNKAELMDSVNSMELHDPAKCIRIFRAMRAQLNGSRGPESPGYVPVSNWIQTAGWPFRLSGATASASNEPAVPPELPFSDAEVAAREISFQRMKLMPTEGIMRYLIWASDLSLSEGGPCFSQPAIADTEVNRLLVPALKEVEFFQLLRTRYRNRRFEITPPPALMPNLRSTRGTDKPGGSEAPGLEFLQPSIAFFDFLPSPMFPSEFDGPGITWLIIANNSPVTLKVSDLPLVFSSIPRAFATDEPGRVQPLWGFQEMAWFDEMLRPCVQGTEPIDGEPPLQVLIPVNQDGMLRSLRLLKWSVRIFRLVQWSGGDIPA